jgi:hypothetical protein
MANVPVNDIDPINQYVATESQTDFVFTYVIYETSDIKVYLNDVLKTEIIDYTVKKSDGSSITSDDLADGLAGGKVVFTSGLTLDDNVTLSRDIPVARTTGFTQSGAFSSGAMNLALNKSIAIQQQLERDLNRTIRQAPSDTGATPVELPALNERKGKYLFFDNTTGVPRVADGASVGGYAVSTFGQGLIDDADAAEAQTTLGISSFAKTLLDDADAATARATLAIPAQRLLPKQITIANGTDTSHDIDFTAGNFDFDDQSGQAALSAITKQIDAAWAEGTNAGGLDTGTVAADTFYYLFAIYNPTTQTSDALFSASKTSPTLPSGYTKKQYVASLATDASQNIRRGKWVFSSAGYTFFLRDRLLELSSSASISTSSRTALAVTCPPNTISIMSFQYDPNGSGFSSMIVTSEFESDQGTGNSATPNDLVTGTATHCRGTVRRHVGDNSTIYYRTSFSTVDSLRVFTLGWEEML